MCIFRAIWWPMFFCEIVSIAKRANHTRKCSMYRSIEDSFHVIAMSQFLFSNLFFSHWNWLLVAQNRAKLKLNHSNVATFFCLFNEKHFKMSRVHVHKLCLRKERKINELRTVSSESSFKKAQSTSNFQ